MSQPNFRNPIILVITLREQQIVDVFVCDENEGWRFNIQFIERHSQDVDVNQIGFLYAERFRSREPPEVSSVVPDWFLDIVVQNLLVMPRALAITYLR
jgi:hypothetical protein